MTGRKRTAAIQVRVTDQEKRLLVRRARQCGLSLSGYLRKLGSGKPVQTLPARRFRELYGAINGLRLALPSQTQEETENSLNELEKQLLAAYTESVTPDGDNEDLAH